MQGKLLQICTLIAALLLPCEGALAGETVTYTYDELGRLVAVATAGTVNDGQSVVTSFDAAGNRTNYGVSGVVSSSPVIFIAGTSVTEGGQLVFVVTRTGPTTALNAASYASANGSAIAPGDYTAVVGTVTFGIGETSKNIAVTTVDDTVIEAAESMTVTLSTPTNSATLGTAIGTGTISDNDP